MRSEAAEPAPPPGRLQRLLKRIWWLHSFGALFFGVGVMLFARQGLRYADKVLVVLGLSWLLVFVAFRFIVGAQNRRPDEKLVRKGVRLVTNYVIKQLYQQMFFFLVPLYASSATWSLSSPNWYIVLLLLICAVVSTMDLVFDNFIMEHRVVAGAMYGLCLFAVLNLLLPLVMRLQHFNALMLAAAATAPSVALLSFRIKAVLSPQGILITLGSTVGLVIGAHFGRVVIPPVPMAMAHAGVGHGEPGEFECVPGPSMQMNADELHQLRCVSDVADPAGVDEPLVHVWRRGRAEIARLTPKAMAGCPDTVRRSDLVMEKGDARAAAGTWSCTVETERGQLVGRVQFKVAAAAGAAQPPATEPRGDAGVGDRPGTTDAGP